MTLLKVEHYEWQNTTSSKDVLNSTEKKPGASRSQIVLVNVRLVCNFFVDLFVFPQIMPPAEVIVFK